MAIFLLIYIIFLIIWLIWSLMSTYHLVRYRFPHTNIIVFLSSYWVTAAFMLAVSIIFISKADWTTMPHIFK